MHFDALLWIENTRSPNVGPVPLYGHPADQNVASSTKVRTAKAALRRLTERWRSAHPERLIADTAYGSGPMLGWLVDRGIAPHIPVIDQAGRPDGTWSRDDFEWDAKNDQYICPEGQSLKQFRRNYSDPGRGPTDNGRKKYRALELTCQSCPSKAKCCPNAYFRSITREEHEDARQVARDIHCPAVHVYMHERGKNQTI